MSSLSIGIVGTGNATGVLHNGQTITVLADKGVVLDQQYNSAN